MIKLFGFYIKKEKYRGKLFINCINIVGFKREVNWLWNLLYGCNLLGFDNVNIWVVKIFKD